MTETFTFELVSPERLLISAQVAEVTVPGLEGDFTVLPDHAPFIALLRPGMLRVPSLNGQPAEVYLRGGFAEVGPAALTVLADEAVEAGDMTAERFAAEIAIAQAALDAAPDAEARYRAVDTLERVSTLAATR